MLGTGIGAQGRLVRIALVATLALGLACAGSGQSGIYYVAKDARDAKQQEVVTPDGLRRLKWEPFELSYVRPGAEISRYDRLLIEPVSIDPNSIDPGFAISSSGIERMKSAFHKAFSDKLASSANFALATAPGPGVLRVQGKITDLVMSTPSARDQDPNQVVVSESFGAMTLQVDVRDSGSGEVLVRVAERQAIAGMGGPSVSNTGAKVAAVVQHFDRWASQLRRQLDKFHSLPSLPIPLD